MGIISVWTPRSAPKYAHLFITIQQLTEISTRNDLMLATSPFDCCPPATMNHVKIFQGQPRRFALSELVQAWYKKFPTDHFGQLEINDSTMLRNKTSTAYSCAEDQILQLKSLEQDFNYLY